MANNVLKEKGISGQYQIFKEKLQALVLKQKSILQTYRIKLEEIRIKEIKDSLYK